MSHSPSLDHLPRPIAFALSGGASLGAIQAGYLRALMEAGIRPDMLVGTSAGALNCAFIGQSWSPERLAELIDFWSSLRFRDVFGSFPLWGALGLPFGARSLVGNRHLVKLGERWITARHDDLEIPTTVIASKLRTGRAVQLSSGNLRRNTLASGALPGVFPPVDVDGELLVDGGVAENVPMNQAAQLGANTIIVLDASYPCELTALPDNVIGRTILVISHTLSAQAVGTLALVPGDRTVIYLPGPCPLNVAPGEFRHARRLIDAAHGSAGRFLRTLEVGGPGIYGNPQFYARTPTPPPGTRDALHRGPMYRVRDATAHPGEESTLADSDARKLDEIPPVDA